MCDFAVFSMKTWGWRTLEISREKAFSPQAAVVEASYESATKCPEADQPLQGMVLIGVRPASQKTPRTDAFGKSGGDQTHVDVPDYSSRPFWCASSGLRPR